MPETPEEWYNRKIEEARNAGDFDAFTNYSNMLSNWLAR